MELKSLVSALTRKGQRLLLPLSSLLIALYVITFGIVIYYSLLHIDRVYQENVRNELNEVMAFYSEQIEDQRELQELIMYGLLANPRVNNAFKKKAGFETFNATFERLTENNVSHLYFIDADRRVMHRAHSPQRFGDQIARATILNAAQNATLTSGLEFGVLGTFTLRSVSPVFEDGEVLGYLEVGMELGHIAHKTEKQFSIALIEFFNKSLIDVDDTLDFMKITGRSSNVSFDETYLINHDPAQPISIELISGIKQHFDNRGIQRLIINSTAIMTAPLHDYSGTQLGYIALLHDISALNKERTESIMIAIFTVLTLGSIAVVIFTYVLRFVEVVVREYLTEKNDKEEELRISLRKLESTQAMMIEQEKYASLGSMVAGIAHEINTPIGISLTASTSLSDHVQKVNQQFDNNALTKTELKRFMDYADESSKLIERNIKRGADLVQSFKQVAVDQSSGVNRQVNLLELLDEIVLSLRPRLKKTKHQVQINCDPELCIDTVPGFWTQIIINLINNSLQHGFEGILAGIITIDVTYDEAHIKVKYSDNGVGIAPSSRAQIFEPFYTTKRNSGGSGLGMHLVYNLISRGLNGTIEIVDSDVGAVFNILVPVIDANSN